MATQPRQAEYFSAPDDTGPIKASDLERDASDPLYIIVPAVVAIIALAVALRLRPSVGAWLRGRGGKLADGAIAVSFGAVLLLWGIWLGASYMR